MEPVLPFISGDHIGLDSEAINVQYLGTLIFANVSSVSYRYHRWPEVEKDRCWMIAVRLPNRIILEARTIFH